MLNSRTLRTVFLCALVLISPLCAMAEEKEFELGGNPGNATAIFAGEQFELTMALGTKDYYKDKTCKFKLKIGKCEIDIDAYMQLGTFDIVVNFKGSGSEITIKNSKSLVANQDGVTLDGKTSDPVKCNPEFGDKRSLTLTATPIETSQDTSRRKQQRMPRRKKLHGFHSRYECEIKNARLRSRDAQLNYKIIFIRDISPYTMLLLELCLSK